VGARAAAASSAAAVTPPGSGRQTLQCRRVVSHAPSSGPEELPLLLLLEELLLICKTNEQNVNIQEQKILKTERTRHNGKALWPPQLVEGRKDPTMNALLGSDTRGMEGLYLICIDKV
jgi:hypothetical protein